ncbi:CoA transferase [Mycobacterium stomatepiae]|uniref:Putative CoA-transferase n=1 Tax=Mycobacterium stomatepiae TaxID=470076 RepID=A0A7I7Q749_9MYCO|nr:CoA transferase [Mycobacterium stomatepiae]BBY21951.1 putative CoA-transferase [Mycobacterium stomatepiae]
MTDAALPSGFLSGLRVLHIGDGIAGSAAATLLATLGADVARPPSTQPRRAGPLVDTPTGPVAAVELVLDRPKRVLASDPNLGDYDIVIADGAYPPPDPTADGVFVSVSPFGADGPHHHRPGGEITAQASGGLLATIEDAHGTPVPAPGYVASKAVGAVAALAALHGLDRHNREGGAVTIDVSAQEAVIFTAALPECAHLLYRCPGRAGSGRYLAPSGAFACRDGLVRITAVENHQWKGLRAALGDPDWATGLDERGARIEHAELINSRVTDWTASRLKADCASVLQANGVPSTPVNHPAELLTSPQLAHRGSLQKTQLAGYDAVVLGPPWSVSPGASGAPSRPGLAGLRIAELTHVLAGPIVGALLGAMGALVTRVEDPQRLDIYRRSGPFADGVAGLERGAYFAVANHSKHSVLLDPSHASQDVAAVVAESDVLIENVGNSRLHRLAVDPELLAGSGRLALRVSGFGSDGPPAGYRLYANNVQAYGGLAGLCTSADGTAARLGTVLADPLSSVVGAVVVAAWALGPRRSTGAVVDLSMAEVVASTVSEFLAAASTGRPTVDEQVRRVVHRATDVRWVVAELCGEQCEQDSVDFVAAMVATNRAEDATHKLRTAGIEAAVVRRAEELITDAHLNARGFFPEIDHPDPDLGTARLVGLPWRFTGEGPVALAPPPALGSSNTDHSRIKHADIAT